MNLAILEEKNLVLPAYLILIGKKFALGLDDFLLLLYFWNYKEQSFDVEVISKDLKLNESEILMAFNTLMSKKLIQLETKKDSVGKRVEYINLEHLYCELDASFKEKESNEKTSDVYSVFESEFGRTISSMEYEIINAWLEKDFSEELILGALKEAVYNGVNSLRYIDKILYEWRKKGYKTMKEVRSQQFSKNSKTEEKELFDYNWLDDNEE